MADFSKVKLGKHPPRIDERTLKLARYFLPSLPPAPPEVDYTGGQADWGMMLNDQLGDCTIAGAAHAEQVWSLSRKGEYTLPDEAVLQKYEQWCGYDPTDPNTDQGGVELDVLNKWRRSSGFWHHPLLAHADVEPTNLENIKKAVELFGGVYIGVQLPLSAQTQRTWDLVPGPDAVPGSWGGHCVFVPKYRTGEDGKVTFTCITWGELIDITQDFWLYSDLNGVPYIDEVHALVAPEFLSLKTGTTPEGLDLTTLESDLHLVVG